MAGGRREPTRLPRWSPGERTTLAVLAAAQFATTAEFTVAAVAAPTVARDLHAPAAATAVSAAFTVSYAALLLCGGRVADRRGPGTALRVAAGLLVATTVGAALAPTVVLLLVGRVGQGAAAAFLQPALLAVLAARFPDPSARARAFAVWGACGAGGLGAGFVLGGLLGALSWRVALGGVAVLLVPAAVRPTRVGPVGAGAAHGPAGPEAAHERATTTRPSGGAPVRVLLRRRPPRRALLVTAAYMASAGSTYVPAAVLWESVRGVSPALTGVALAPLAAAVAAGSAITGRRGSSPGTSLMAGFALAAVGLGLTAATATAPAALPIAALALSGLGNGMVFAAMTDAGLGAVAAPDRARAAALLVTAQYAGGTAMMLVLTPVLADPGAGAVRTAVGLLAAVAALGLVVTVAGRVGHTREVGIAATRGARRAGSGGSRCQDPNRDPF